MSEKPRDDELPGDPTKVGGLPSPESRRDYPNRIANFVIESQLGSGGMGSVYKAYDEAMRRTVALKVLHPAHRLSDITQTRFVREAWIAGQLSHPNIIEVFTRGEEKGYQYIAMEYAEHGSLADYIEGVRKTIPVGAEVSDTIKSDYVNAIVRKFVELARALALIHEKGFVHRDIKPNNVMIAGSERRFKFADFGIAHADDMTNLTRRGDFIGTVKYMSPELLTAHRATVDKRTDIYSLGVTLYEALTTSLPFEADSEERYINEILAGHVIPARSRNRRIPKDLETVTLKATHHDVDSRYQNASEFADDLERVLAHRPILAKREGPLKRLAKASYRQRYRLVAAILGLVVIGGSSFVGWKRWEHRNDDRRIIAVLRHAVETKTPPIEFEPDWPRLARVLFQDLSAGDRGEKMRLFLKANNTLEVFARDYTLFSHTVLSVTMPSIDLFDFRGTTQTQMPEDWINTVYFASPIRASVVSQIQASVDHGAFVGIGRMANGYRTTRRNTSSLIAHIRNVADTLYNGRHEITVRAISSHYVDAALYLPYQSDLSKLQMPLLVTASGDSVYEYDGGVGGPKFMVLTGSPLAVASVFMTDTLIETKTQMIFDKYPDGFPKLIFDPLKETWYSDSNRIVSLTVVKKKDSFENIFQGWLDERTPIPIAATIRVHANSLELPELAGMYFQWHQTLKVAYGSSEQIYTSWSNCGVRDTVTATCSIDRINLSDADFDRLVAAGATPAKLVLAPSIEAARFFGNIDEFWGDTLHFDIVLRAIDETEKK